MARKKTASSADAGWTPSPPDHRAPRRVRPDGQTNLLKDGRRHGLWVERRGYDDAVVETPYDQGWISGTVQVWQQGSLVHTWSAAPDPSRAPDGPGGGEQRWALPNGASVTTFDGALRVGWERQYLPDGALILERFFDGRGLQQGVQRNWDGSGALLLEQHVVDGLLHGPKWERSHDGTWTRQDYEAGELSLDSRKKTALLKNLNGARDHYAVFQALAKAVPVQSAPGYLWSLVRSGAWDPVAAWFWGGLDYLARYPLPDPELARALVRGGARKDGVERQNVTIPGWPCVLDRLAQAGYALQDDPRWAALAEALPAPAAVGVHFVRGRNGAALAPEQATAVLAALAVALVTGQGAITDDLSFRDDAGALRTLRVETRPADLAPLVARFGGEARFSEALGPAVRAVTEIFPYRIAALIPRLNPEDLAALLARLHLLQAQPLELLGVREDLDVAGWARVADALLPEGSPEPFGNLPALAEAVFILAAAAARRAGTALPESFDRLVTTASLRRDSARGGPVPGLAELRAALAGLPLPRLHAIAARLLGSEVHFRYAAVVLGVAPHEPGLAQLVDRMLAMIEPGWSASDLRIYAIEVGLVGAPLLPLLTARWSESKGVTRGLTHLALLSAMAEMARQGQTPPEALDALIDSHLPPEAALSPSIAEDFLWNTLANIASALPGPRAEAALLRCLDASQLHWSAALRLVPWATTAKGLAATGQMLGERALSLKSNELNVTKMIADLGGAAGLTLAEILQGARKNQAALAATLREALPEGQRADFDAAAVKSARDEDSDADLGLAGRAAALSATLDLPKLPIYLLEVTEERAKGKLTRAGGKAIGVPPDRWPERCGQPMVHLLTLDLDELPAMRARRAALAGARAMAVFVPSWDGDDLDQGQVVLLSEAEVAAHGERGRAARGEPAMALEVACVEVPEVVFLPEERWEGLPEAQQASLSALRDLISSAQGRALGRPFWLQEDYTDYDVDEREGRFLLQLNERLVDVNLGDSGELYVFEDAVCMQCC